MCWSINLRISRSLSLSPLQDLEGVEFGSAVYWTAEVASEVMEVDSDGDIRGNTDGY